MMIPKEEINHYKRLCEFNRLKAIEELLKEGDMVLDVGCGIGTYTSKPLSSLPISVVGIDSDEETIQYAKKHNDRDNLDYVIANGETFKSDNKFDVIVCSHVLEHSENPAKLLANLWRILDDNGYLYVAIPNGFGWFELQNFLPRMLWKTSWGEKFIKSMMGLKDTINIDSQHINFFTVRSIKKLLNNTGWEIIREYKDEFLGGIVFDRIMNKCSKLYELNEKMTDKIPMVLANGWIFICRKSC